VGHGTQVWRPELLCWQLDPGPQFPQWSGFPQPSVVIPQGSPRLAQLIDVQGTLVHTPEASQVCPAGHDPQSRSAPQPSVLRPHWYWACRQLFGVQSAPTPQTLAWQERPQEHAPQSSTPPQPSGAWPQGRGDPRSWQVIGTHPPQTFGVPPPPQVWGAGHVPHWMSPPQQSLAGPQSSPRSTQVIGVHSRDPHWPGGTATHPAPNPHAAGPAGQVPQSRVLPQPSLQVPHT
jgi:hypothetical protein